MDRIVRLIKVTVVLCFLTIALLSVILMLKFNPSFLEPKVAEEEEIKKPELWRAPDIASLEKDDNAQLILYGRELIARTANYLGPQGSVMHISNGMNCQNCHLDAGTKPFGNNYGAVASLYPKFRARSGALESIEKRVNDCLERSLNGGPLDSLSKEMRAMVAYITWLGKDVPKGKKAEGSGLVEMEWLPRAADPAKGKKLYMQQCLICHGRDGEGQKVSADAPGYIYPPLWGANSFNTAAGLYRISNLARYIFANMPNGATFDKPTLTQEQAWDIAAYIESMPRPEKAFAGDWPKLETKPVDHPFGPYTDSFSERQHKYGPFREIIDRGAK
ncbi:MAG TPA: c-type cytochrome [Cyclobacteriaceae bacterium]|nr:c-type cytochrome [Cyclobacteriaceae bacterium]